MRDPGRALWASVLLLAGGCGSSPPPNPTPLSTDFTIRRIIDTGGPEMSVRLVPDPVSNALFVLKRDGRVLRLTLPPPGASSLARLHPPVDTRVSDAQGVAFVPGGQLYLL